MSSNSNFNMLPRAGVERSDAGMPIRHDKHDLATRLGKEEDTNSLRQFTADMRRQGNEIRKRFKDNPMSVSQSEIDSVPMIHYRFEEQNDGFRSTTTDFNSKVEVDVHRLLYPATENGQGTSRFGKGRSLMCVKRDRTRTHRSAATWHQSGETYAYGYSWPSDGAREKMDVAKSSDLPSTDVRRSWFRSESFIENDCLKKVKTPRELGVFTKEVLLITNDQSNIDDVHRTITVVNKIGEVVFFDDSWDGTGWKCWEEIVNTRPDLFKLWPKTRKEIATDSFVETQHYQMLKEDPDLIITFPNYGHCTYQDSRGFIFLGDEMIEDCPVRMMAYDRSGKKARPEHTVSQTSFGVIVRFMNADGTANNFAVLPTPTTVKILFDEDCKIYTAGLDSIRKSHPSGWLKYNDDKPPKTDTIVSEQWHDTQHGRSIVNEVDRDEGETDDKYIKRVKANRSSRKSKQKRRSPPASPASASGNESSVEVPTIADEDMAFAQDNLARLQRMLAREDIRTLLNL